MSVYTIRSRFTTASGDTWRRFVQWSGRQHAEEIVSLDESLCPPIITELTEEDWRHNIHADNMVYFFADYDYLLTREPFDSRIDNLLELTKSPDQQPAPTNGFAFCGYDIVDAHGSISVLLNCGSFEGVFSPEATNAFGLIDQFGRAAQIAQTIRETHPADPHCCDCRVWAIARYVGS